MISNKRQKSSEPQPLCRQEGCFLKVRGQRNFYCVYHFQECAADGCTNRRYGTSNFCREHLPPPFGDTFAFQYKHATAVAEKEWVLRWKRSSHLRKKLPILNRAQDGRCASYLKNGEGFCPWGDRRVPHTAQQVDHIVPYSETQDDSIENLQMQCSCCHSHKSTMESRATIARITNVATHLVPWE